MATRTDEEPDRVVAVFEAEQQADSLRPLVASRVCGNVTAAVPARSPRRAGTSTVAAVCIAMLVESVLYSIIVPVLPVYAGTLGASSAAIGLLFALYAVGLLLATPVFGVLSDRVGRRRPMLAGSFGLTAATIMFALADNYPLLATARFVQGVAAAAVWTAGVALVADVADARKLGKVMGIVMACMSVGLIVGPPAGGILEQVGGLRMPFVVVTAAAALSGLAQFLFAHDVRGAHDASGSGSVTARVRGRHRRRPASHRRESSVTRDRARVLLADPDLQRAMTAVFLAACAMSMLEAILPLDLTGRLAAGPGALGVVFGTAALVHGATSPLIGALADRLPRIQLMTGGLIVAGGFVPILIMFHTLVGVTGVLVGFAIAFGFVFVPAFPELAAVVERHGGGTYATVYGIFNIVYNVGMVVGPLAGGVGAEGSFPVTLVLTGAVLGIGGLFLLLTTPTSGSRDLAGAASPVLPAKNSNWHKRVPSGGEEGTGDRRGSGRRHPRADVDPRQPARLG